MLESHKFSILFRSALTILAIGLFAPSAAALEARALLIAAADYYHLPSLKAPPRDAKDMSEALQALGVPAENIQVLSDASGSHATRQNIIDAMDRLKRESMPGELVVFYYSGHGTQVRDQNGDESDQRDEALVPVDAPLRMEFGDVVIDDYIKSTIDHIRANGANVWAIFDSCLSGTLTRNGNASTRIKGVTAATTSSSQGETREASWIDPTDEAASANGMGSLVAFYSSRSHESSLERRVADGENTFRSIYTAALVDALRQNPRVSFRQVSEIVRTAVVNGPGHQTPTAEGDGLDQNLPNLTGRAADPGFGWWPLKNGRVVDVGWVGHVEAGSLFSLHKSAALEPSEVHARVSRSGGLRSILEHCRRTDDGTCTLAQPPNDLENYHYAKLIDPAITDKLTLAIDMTEPPTEASLFFAEKLRDTIEKADWERHKLSIRLVDQGEEARISLRIESDKVYIVVGVAATDELEGRYPGLSHNAALTTEYLAHRIRGAWQIDRLRGFSQSHNTQRHDWISIEATIEPALLDDAALEQLAEFGTGNAELDLEDAKQVCRTSDRSAAFQLKTGAELTDCDRVTVQIVSRAPDSVQVYLMYYGQNGCLTQVFPMPSDADGASGLLEPSSSTVDGEASAQAGRFFVLTRNNNSLSLGKQGLIVLALRLKDGRNPGYSTVDHCSPSGFRARSDTVSDVVTYLLARPSLRSNSGRWESSDIALDHLSWSVEPYDLIRPNLPSNLE